jgi:hypothetical protein
MNKKILVAGALICASTFVFAQAQTVNRSGSSNKETYVENEYLNDIDTEIIMGLADADELDTKLVALQYINDAIDEGNTSKGVIEALDKLSGEGILSESRTNGRKVNNFPEVRRQACLLMAKVPSEHSKNQLKNVLLAEDEPMVLSAAVQSLGKISADYAEEVIDAITYMNKRNMVLNPTSSLAWEVIDAYEKLAPSANNRKIMVSHLTEIASNYRYTTPVREKALKLLKTLTAQGSSSSSNADAK